MAKEQSGRSGRRPPQETRRSHINEQYPAYVRNNTPGARDLRRMRREEKEFSYRPLISIVLPVYNPEGFWLERALDSVMSQAYPNWGLCVCDDASTEEHVREVLARYERLDDRIKVKYSAENRGISGASNAALSLATGEFVGLLDHDDELSPDALFEVAKLLQQHPGADLIYSDEDYIDEEGNRSRPHFKPGWSPDLLLCHNYITHLAVFRREIVEEIGGFREGFEGSQDYDLTLRSTERTEEIYHIPKILYHWRKVEGSVTTGAQNKPYTHERSRQALSEALERRGMRGTVEPSEVGYNFFRVKREIEDSPKISIIIPTRDNVSLLRTCLESIESLTTYRNYEIIIVDNESEDPETLEYLRSMPHRVLEFREPFSHSKVNNFGVSRAEGEYVLLLNDDTEVISGEWLEAMLEHAQRPEIGAVGARLLFPDGRVQHAGVPTGVGVPWTPGVATHIHHFFPGNSPGYVGAAKLVRNYSAVTAACMMLRREVFEELGGFDEENLPTSYNDVDLCLKIGERGYRIVYTPYAELYHHETVSRKRGIAPEWHGYMRRRWGERLDSDPYYNPNFSRFRGDFNLRADLMIPEILRNGEGRGERDVSLQEMTREERREYLEARYENARSSPRTSLVPVSGQSDAQSLNHIKPESLIWIFGHGRTGSTWLSNMMKGMKGHLVWFEPCVGEVFGEHYYLRARSDQLESETYVLGNPQKQAWLKSIRSFVLEGAESRFPRLGAREHLVIKEPHGSIGAPLLSQALPESRMVLLIRDPRDVIASSLVFFEKEKISWAQSLETLAKHYAQYMGKAIEAYHLHAGPKVLVKYEDLIEDTLGTMKYIYSSLGIAIDQEELARVTERHSWENMPEEKKGVGKFYRKGTPGGWREDLNPEQVEKIEEITAPILSEFYEQSLR